MLESEDRQDAKRKQGAQEQNRETDDLKALIQKQKQMQKHTAAELGLLRGELNKQVTRISEVQESVTLKVEKSVSSVEESMSTKISAVEESMSNKISEVDETVAIGKDPVLSLIHI